VNSILEDKNGKFWFGAENGVYCYDGKTFTSFLDNPNLINDNKFDPKLVLSMIEDKKGNIRKHLDRKKIQGSMPL